jgi:hypothetical protein
MSASEVEIIERAATRGRTERRDASIDLIAGAITGVLIGFRDDVQRTRIRVNPLVG